MNDWRIGVSTASFYPDYLTEEALTTAAALGFPVFEVFLQADAEYTPAFGEELDRRRRASGVEIHSLHLYATLFDLWSPYPRLREEVRERFLRLLEVAARVEARALTWHGLRYGVDNPRLIDAFFESLIWATERTVKAGLTLCVENVSWCYLRQPEQVEDLQHLGLPVGFTFDSFQAAESGADPVALLEAMGSQLTTVHLADYTPAGPRHLPPGEGLVEWERVLAGLERVGYAGPLIIEVAQLERPEALPAMRDFLRAKIAGRPT